MCFIKPLGDKIIYAVNLFVKLMNQVVFCIMHIQVIQYKAAIFFQRLGNGTDGIVMLPAGFKISKAGEEIKSIIKVIDPERQAHIVPVKMQFVCLITQRLLNTVFAQVDACYIKTFFCQVNRMPPFATGHIQHQSIISRLQVVD